jgi:hypothetical protein
MDTVVLLLSILFIIIGIIIMLRNKFYKYDTSSMLFPATLKVFMSGLIFFIIGFYGFVYEMSKLFK